MEIWTTIILTLTAVLKHSWTLQNNENCSLGTSFLGGQQITCTNVTNSFFQYNNLTLNRSHWLICKKCNLTIIKKETFNFKRNNISYLTLSENNIVALRDFAFKRFPILKFLNLKENSIENISLRSFVGLKKLMQLDLSYNDIIIIPSNVFLELENLDVLNLNRNHIQMVESDAFSGLLNLKYLYLNFNKLKVLEANMFSFVPNLKILYLENNEIVEINPLAFNDLKNLNFLYLNNNNIQYLVQYNFKQLISLVDLQLRLNTLKQIQTSSFNGLKSLKTLYLGENDIEIIQPYGLIGLNTLEILDLMGNNFTYFSLDYFKDMEKLIILWLGNNKINNFTVEGSSDILKSLTLLDLMNNELEEIDFHLLHEKMPELQEILIGENPWKCDSVMDMYAYFQIRNVYLCSGNNCTVNATETFIEDICDEHEMTEDEGYATDFVPDFSTVCDFNVFVLCLSLYFTICY